MYAAAGGASLASRRHRKQMIQVPTPRLHHPPPPMAMASTPSSSYHQPPLGHSGHHANGRLHAVYGSQEGGTGGKAAWQERRGSTATAAAAGDSLDAPQKKANEAHRRWMKRNRVHDASYGGSSDEDEWPGGPGGIYGHQSAAANALLYVGLGTVSIGLVIAFVGTGDKGFKTLELRLIGPTLIGAGLLCCFIRVLLCVCPSRCLSARQRNGHRSVKSPPPRPLSPNTNQPRSREEIALVDRKPPPPPEPPPPPHLSLSVAAQSPIAATSLFLRTETADALLAAAAASSSALVTTASATTTTTTMSTATADHLLTIPSSTPLVNMTSSREPPALVHHPPSILRTPSSTSKIERPRLPANGGQRRELVLTPSKLGD